MLKWLIIAGLLILCQPCPGQCNPDQNTFNPTDGIITPQVKLLSIESENVKDPCQHIIASTEGIMSSDDVMNNQWYYMIFNKKGVKDKILIELNNSQTDQVDLYMRSNNQFRLINKAGDLVPYSERTKKHRNIISSLNSEKDTIEILINVINRGSYSIPIKLFKSEYFQVFDNKRSLIIGMYLGLVILFILFVSASLVLADYDHTHFYYLLYLVFTGLYFFLELGYSDIYFWPDTPSLEEAFTLAFALGSTLSFLLLVYHLFQIQHSTAVHRISFKLLFGLICFAIMVLISGAIKLDMVFISIYYLILFLVGATFLFAFAAGYDAVKRKVAYAKYFLIAFSAMILGTIVKPLSLLGILPYNTYVHYGGMMGHSFEIICLSTLLLLEFFRRMKYAHSLETQIVQLEKSALQAQMNPHFIFNCLNSIQSYIAKNEARTAMDYLSKFARLVRNTLNASKAKTISLNEEIEMLHQYIQLEQLRFKDRFEYEILCKESMDQEEIEIPPMLIQPFIENSIIHGFKGIDRKGKIIISFNLQDPDLLVTIVDNGVGYHPEKSKENHKSLAMSITNQRLSLLNPENMSIPNMSIENLADQHGTKVTLRIHQSEDE